MTDTTSEPDPKLGLVLQERYLIQHKLGEGGMGDVYAGVHQGIGKRVAIKFLNKEYAANEVVVERFKREAQAATLIGHEHIIDVNDLGALADGTPYMVMERLQGRELGELIMEEHPVAVDRVIAIALQVCKALGAAHDKGIVHRDLKPENIFLIERNDNPDFVKILDFGISKITGQNDKVTPKLTSTGTVIGTPHYMSPEQAAGSPPLDHRTDIYSLGVILYHALTNTLPFDGETFGALVVQIMTKDLEPLRSFRSDVPEALERAIAKAMSRSPDDRFESAAEFARALQNCRAHVASDPTAPATTGEANYHLGSLSLDMASAAPKALAHPSSEARVAPPATVQVSAPDPMETSGLDDFDAAPALELDMPVQRKPRQAIGHSEALHARKIRAHKRPAPSRALSKFWPALGMILTIGFMAWWFFLKTDEGAAVLEKIEAKINHLDSETAQ